MATIKRQPLERVQSRLDQILREEGPILTLADAARQMQMPLATLADAVRNKRVESLNVFGRSFVRLSDVQQYARRTGSRATASRWAESVRAITAIDRDAELPTDLSHTFRQRLYGRVQNA